MQGGGQAPGSVSASFRGAAAGDALPPRRRGAPLRDEESSSHRRAEQPPQSVSTKSLYKILFIEDKKRPGTYCCRLCGDDIASGHNSTRNLGRHLEAAHADAYKHAHEEVADSGSKRAQLEDLARNSEAKRARQGTMESFLVRLDKDVENTTREAFWMLWLDKRGIAYDAIQDPLFHLARQVRTNMCVLVLTPIPAGQSSCPTTPYVANHEGIDTWCHLRASDDRSAPIAP